MASGGSPSTESPSAHAAGRREGFRTSGVALAPSSLSVSSGAIISPSPRARATICRLHWSATVAEEEIRQGLDGPSICGGTTSKRGHVCPITSIAGPTARSLSAANFTAASNGGCGCRREGPSPASLSKSGCSAISSRFSLLGRRYWSAGI